ncbi:MAG: 2-phosphosulfolactate phosphatase family protein [Candidatus Velthaea sp.]
MIERIDVAVTPASVPLGLRGAAVVVIDVLRATTTITRALANGALAVIPCLEPEDAIAVRNRVGRDRVLLGGERDSHKISGFDLDNSPRSYARDVVHGKTIAFTTTNGTRALSRVGHAGASVVLCGALINRRAVVRAIEAADAQEALLVCAGHEGTFSLEDFLCAGAIVDAFVQRHPHIVLSDGGRAAALTYRTSAARIADAVASGEHAQALAASGFRDDILAAATLDVADVVPVFRNGELVAG